MLQVVLLTEALHFLSLLQQELVGLSNEILSGLLRRLHQKVNFIHTTTRIGEALHNVAELLLGAQVVEERVRQVVDHDMLEDLRFCGLLLISSVALIHDQAARVVVLGVAHRLLERDRLAFLELVNTDRRYSIDWDRLKLH